MDQTIVIKRSSVSGRIPSALQPGELAVNLADKLLYTSDVSGNVFPLNSQVDFSGSATAGPGEAIQSLEIKSDGTWEIGAVAIPETWAASDTPGGPATSAEKLDNDEIIGGPNRPVYFSSNGVPVAIDHQINADVPVGAVFTDTTEFTIGANVVNNPTDPVQLTSSSGTNSVTYGVTHAMPQNLEEGYYGDYAVEDQSDTISIGKRAIINLPSYRVDKYGHIGLSAAKQIKVDLSTTTATTTTSGLMSAEDKAKLDGIEALANNYVLPEATNTSIGGVRVLQSIEPYQTDAAVSSAAFAEWIRTSLANSFSEKVSVVSGKGLSTNDFTTAYRNLIDTAAQSSDVYTKAEVDALIQNTYRIMGKAATSSELFGNTSAVPGDVWIAEFSVTDSGTTYPAGTAWVCISPNNPASQSNWAATSMTLSGDLDDFAKVDVVVLTKSTVAAALGF